MIKKVLCNQEDLARAVARQNELIFARFVGINITNGMSFEFVFDIDEPSNNSVQSDGAYCSCKVFSPAPGSTNPLCYWCGKPPRR